MEYLPKKNYHYWGWGININSQYWTWTWNYFFHSKWVTHTEYYLSVCFFYIFIYIPTNYQPQPKMLLLQDLPHIIATQYPENSSKRILKHSHLYSVHVKVQSRFDQRQIRLLTNTVHFSCQLHIFRSEKSNILLRNIHYLIFRQDYVWLLRNCHMSRYYKILIAMCTTIIIVYM